MRRRLDDMEQKLMDKDARYSHVKDLAIISTTTFPPSFFLDGLHFQRMGSKIPDSQSCTPTIVLDILGETLDDVKPMIRFYFDQVHPWISFVSRQRLESDLTQRSRSLRYLPADLALLLLAMKLATADRMGCAIYLIAEWHAVLKSHLATAEAMGDLSNRLLQATMLLTVYEIGQAHYPAAYLSAGHCARLGYALGINNRQNAPQVTRSAFGDDWLEEEEIKRMWWTVMLLDRCVSIGRIGHALGTNDPTNTCMLPCADSAWDQGIMIPSEPLYTGTPLDIKAGPFQRTCQATHLLGQVIKFRNGALFRTSQCGVDPDQLLRTLKSLVNLLQEEVVQEGLDYSTALCLCFSGILHLCTFIAERAGVHSATSKEVHVDRNLMQSLENTAIDVYHFFDAHSMQHGFNMNPLCGDSLYQAAKALSRLSNAHLSHISQALRNQLQMMGTRCNLAFQYAALLEEMNVSRPPIFSRSA